MSRLEVPLPGRSPEMFVPLLHQWRRRSLDAEKKTRETETSEIFDDQQRLRENMKAPRKEAADLDRMVQDLAFDVKL